MNPLLTFAFAAGMLAPLNPCGFALLPAWIAYSIGENDTAALPVRLARAMRGGIALTLGFAGALVAAGLVISAGARALITAAPWLGLAVGAVLVVLGAAMLTGWTLRVPLDAAAAVPAGGVTGTGRLFLFGVGYAAASLSCTLGVLLAVIAQAQATTSYLGQLSVFGAYAAGAATVLVVVAVATAAAGAALTSRLTALTRYVHKAVAVVVIATGAYLIWYWYPAVTGSAAIRPSLERWSTAATTWMDNHTGILTAIAIVTVLAVAAAALGYRVRRRRTASQAPSGPPDCCAPDTAQTPQDLTLVTNREDSRIGDSDDTDYR